MPSLHDLDEYGEWRNPGQHPELVALLEAGLGDYDTSVTHLRLRPDTTREGVAFWLRPTSRAHLLNALLLRDYRSLAKVQQDVLIAEGKLYKYMRARDNIPALVFHPRRHTSLPVIGYHGERLVAVRASPSGPRGAATLRLADYPDPVTGVWSASTRAFRLQEPLPGPVGLFDKREGGVWAAAELLSVHANSLSRALLSIGVSHNGSVYFSHLAKLFPDQWWVAEGQHLLAHLGLCGRRLEAVQKKPDLFSALTRRYPFVWTATADDPRWRTIGSDIASCRVQATRMKLAQALSTAPEFLPRYLLSQLQLPAYAWQLLAYQAGGTFAAADAARLVYWRRCGLIEHNKLTGTGTVVLSELTRLARWLDALL